MNYDDWRRQRQRRRACCTHIHRHTQQNEAVYYSFLCAQQRERAAPCRAVKLPTYIIIIYITTITFPSFHRERIVARHGEREKRGGSHIYILDWDVYVCACKWPCCRLCADHIRIFLLFYLFRGGHQQHDLGDVSSSSSSFFHHFYIIFWG